MKQRREWAAAAAVLSATAGVGFSSGRQVVLFFTQMGWTSWIGIAFASASFGLLCGIVCRFARETGAKSFSTVFTQALDIRQSAVVSALHGLLMACVAGVMIAMAGTLAALTLPLRNAFWIGVFLSTGLALLLSMHRMRLLPAVGALAIALCAVFYIALALDPREVRFHRQYETVPELSGNLSAALILSVLHAALNASIAGEAIARFSAFAKSPIGFGLRCGAVMSALLCAVNAALLRGGERLLSQELPTVLLAARWGVFGYYGGILVMWLCSMTTLTAAIGSLAGRVNDTPRSRGALLLALLGGAILSAAAGFEGFFEFISPMLGCAAAFTLFGLICTSGFATAGSRSHASQNMTKSSVKLYEHP